MTKELNQIDSPFFSVIIPIYNKEPYLGRAINSVLNQRFQDFELIIVCDPSTDNSNSEVAKFTDPRIRIFHRDKPGPGGYAARNLGIKEARAEWIAFLDADDEWYDNYLEFTHRNIAENTSVDIFSCGKLIENSGVVSLDGFSRSQRNNRGVYNLHDYLYHCVYTEKPFNTNSVVVRRKQFSERVRFPQGRTNRSGDIYLWVLLVAKSKKFYWCSDIGSYTHKDVVGVSKTSVPQETIFIDMVEELRSNLKDDELRLLIKYSNRLIKSALIEKKRMLKKRSCSISKCFFFREEPIYSLKWLLIISLPRSVILMLDKIKVVVNLVIRAFLSMKNA